MRERGGNDGEGRERGRGEEVRKGEGVSRERGRSVLHRSWRGVLNVSLSSLGVVVPPLFRVGGILHRFAA